MTQSEQESFIDRIAIVVWIITMIILMTAGMAMFVVGAMHGDTLMLLGGFALVAVTELFSTIIHRA